jgi:membrane-associated phospholipid phosphatase
MQIWPGFDQAVADLIGKDRGELFTFLMKFISAWGESYMMVATVLMAALLFYWKGLKKEAWLSLSVFIADVINIGLKVLFNRPRPQEMDIFPSFQQNSFPSGHVVHYVVFFGFVLYVMVSHRHIPQVLRSLIGGLCAFLIAGVSVSRIYLGTHWASDILIAYVIGFLMLTFLIIYDRHLIHSGVKK